MNEFARKLKNCVWLGGDNVKDERATTGNGKSQVKKKKEKCQKSWGGDVGRVGGRKKGMRGENKYRGSLSI